MNVFDAYLQDRPAQFYRFDASGASFPNQMGDDRELNASVSISRSNNTPIVRGSAGPVLVDDSVTLQIPTNRLSPSSKKNPVSLECWVLPIEGPVSILSHDGIDGLVFDSESIKFVVEFENEGTAEASWLVPDYMARYHVVGIFNGKKVSLYINGDLKSEVDLTPDQNMDSLKVQSDENLYTKSPAGSQLIDAIAVYEYALSANSVLSHYLAGNNSRSAVDNVMSFGGLVWTFDDFDRNIAMSKVVDLDSGISVLTTYRDGVRPTVDDAGLSEAGTWTTSIPISVTGLSNIEGVKVDWEGDGHFTVEGSFDQGSSWVTLENGQLVPGSTGIDPTGEEIDVRVTFDGAIQNDVSVVRQLSYVVYPDATIRSDNSTRTVTLNGDIATSSISSELIESYSNAGLRIPAEATATLNADDSDDPQDTATVEIWFRLNSISDGVIIDGLEIVAGAFDATGTAYFNGSTTVPTPVQDQWAHAVLVGTASNDPIIIGGGPAINVGMVAVYRKALSPDEVSRLYMSYFGSPTAVLSESSSVSVQEKDEMYNLYDYDWQIISSGR